MSANSLNEEAIFKIAAEISSPDARSEYLQQACGDDQALLERVLALLRADEESASFLESPPPGIAATALAQPIAEKPGTQIGPYKLLQQIGEGGFGVVYMSEQSQPLRRKVALKIIKPGMDTKAVIARFEAERQALALMDHPNIAKVLDAGTTQTGRPYFVMELVKGIAITDFCDENSLSIKQRLDLFVTVCRAIQHAHQKGIIHRDLKPSNVMVTLQDNQPVPKVIDFGVAKAISQQLTERTMFTAYGQMIGTPIYMSPEQAQMSEFDVDTRSDIYSLGIMLYEILTGSTPLDAERLRKSGYAEMQRLIREEESPKPSVRLSTQSEDAVAKIARRRSIGARQLSSDIRGDLDWIVMKALEKDRNRRYDTALGFADDILRYVRDETVEARPPSTGYRLKKYVRRHRRLLATVSAFGAVLLAATALSMVMAIQATNARKQSEKQERFALASFEEAEKARKDAENQTARADRARLESDVAKYASQIRLADENYSKVNSSEAKRILESTDPELRDWEYERLNTVWDSRQKTFAKDRGYRCVAITPDGRLVAGAGDGGNIRIFEFESGQPAGELTTNGKKVFSLEFSLDGKKLVAATDQSAHLWEFTSRREIGKIDIAPAKPFPDSVSKHPRPYMIQAQRPLVTLDPKGEKIAVAVPGSVQVWDSSFSRKLLDIPNTENADKYVYVSGLDFHPDGKRLLVLRRTALFSDTVQVERQDLEHLLLDTESGKVIRKDAYYSGGFFFGYAGSIQFDPSGKWFVSPPWASIDLDPTSSVHICDTESGQVERSVNTGTLIGNNLVATSQDGGQVIAGHSTAGTVSISDLGTGKKVRLLVSEFGDQIERYARNDAAATYLTSVAVSPDGRKIVAGFASRMISIGPENQQFVESLVGWDLNETVGIEPLYKADMGNPLPDEEGLIESVLRSIPVFHDRAGWFAQHVAIRKRFVDTEKYWKPSKDDPITQFVEFRNVATGKPLFTLGHRQHAEQGYRVLEESIAFDRNGSLMARAYLNEVEIWDVHQKKQLQTLRGASGLIVELKISPTGRHVIAVATFEPEIEEPDKQSFAPPEKVFEFLIWDRVTQELVFHEEDIVSGHQQTHAWRMLDFLPSGTALLRCYDKYALETRSSDKAGIVAKRIGCNLETVDLETGKRIEVEELDYAPTEVCFTPDGKRAYFAVGWGGTPEPLDGIWMWDLRTGDKTRVHKGSVVYPSVSPSGRRLMFREYGTFLNSDVNILLLDTQTHQLVFEMMPEKRVGDPRCFFTPDGEVVRYDAGQTEKILAHRRGKR